VAQFKRGDSSTYIAPRPGRTKQWPHRRLRVRSYTDFSRWKVATVCLLAAPCLTLLIWCYTVAKLSNLKNADLCFFVCLMLLGF
jgi:hypothetical protein